MRIKYSQTLPGHFFAPLHKFKALSGSELGKQLLVYGGEQKLLRDGVEVLGWRETGKW